jgi:hypothetical protein
LSPVGSIKNSQLVVVVAFLVGGLLFGLELLLGKAGRELRDGDRPGRTPSALELSVSVSLADVDQLVVAEVGSSFHGGVRVLGRSRWVKLM